MIHTPNTKLYDAAIIGGGVLGLWAARHAIKRGESVVLIEKRHIGAGASGGFLGALMPHMPDGWNAKKQFQLEGLSPLPKVIAELEAETGIDCGYRMCGRIMPIPNEMLASQIGRRSEGALERWPKGNYISVDQIGDNSQLIDGWINPDIAKFGFQKDTFSARINPRQYVKALEAYVRPRCDVLENSEARDLQMSEGFGEVLLNDGSSIQAKNIIVANGYEAYPLLQPFMGEMADKKLIGRGVKGQAVLLEFAHDDTLPIVYHDGAYVVPHSNNKVAIGSTSVSNWQDQAPDAFDENDMGFYERAIELVPALKAAPIIERWASVRPRNTLKGRGTEPFFGPVPGHRNLIALVGGFKITLGIAHIAGIQPL